MKGKRIIITLLEVLIVIGTTIGLIFAYKEMVSPETVYVFSRNIDSGVKITESMISTVQVPKAALQSAKYITNIKDFTDTVTTGKVYKGQYVLKANICPEKDANPLDNDEFTADLRKVAVKANFDTAAGGTLQKGDTVDVLVTVKSDGNNTDYQTTTFLTDVLVYNVIDGDGATYVYDEEKVADNKSKNDSATTLSTVILALSTGDSELLVNNAAKGEITIVSKFQ